MTEGPVISGAAEPDPSAGLPLRILLVEDDDGDALLFEELLLGADLDVAVVRVRTVGQAEGALAADGFACAVLDLGLPDADGLTALHRLRTAAPRVPLLVLTGLADGSRGLDAVAAGAQDYLVKGRVDGELLARSIRYAVERQRAEHVQDQLRAAQLTAVENARLERGLLPRPIVSDPRVAVATRYRPGRERTLLGGDFFDVVETADGMLHVLVGDVCGHDPDAAALGVCLRIAWRTLVLGGHEGDELPQTLDEVLVHERATDEAFATACMLTVAPDRRSAELRVAGHPLPILVAGGTAHELAGPAPRPPLGVGAARARGPWPGTSVELPDAWHLLAYTDGLIEGRVDGGAERLGSAGLVELVRRHVATGGTPPAKLIDGLIATALDLNGGDLTDDVAVLVLSVADERPGRA